MHMLWHICKPTRRQLLNMEVNYVLDDRRPKDEIIVKDGQTCLTRENLISLGKIKYMDSMVGNACLRLVKAMIQKQGKYVFIMDLHIPPTWLQPLSCDPLCSLPVNCQKKDLLIFPLWTPGHFLLCGCGTPPGSWTMGTVFWSGSKG